MNLSLLTVAIQYEHDIVAVRQWTRQVTGLLGFDAQDQTRMATAVSEIARNAFQYAGGGKLEFLVEGKTAPQIFIIRVRDQGPGISDLARILAGQYQSSTGMGLGITGARRLMDQFHIESAPGQGTTVWLKKMFPRKAGVVTAARGAQIVAELSQRRPENPLEEIQQQNQELLRTLEELRKRQEELTRLNHELEDTNRGVVALYAELDEKADHLRRADELKTRFLSNMSHEFRTPVNSVLALSQILLDRTDGPLTPEQEKQVLFIRKASENLSELVNDLLDLAKVEAGKVVVRPMEFQVSNLFGALRGMLRPLLVNQSVSLVFDEPGDLSLCSDEGKVSQILRNFISNALKFTERGEVRVSARMNEASNAVTFSVSDSGLGIAPEDQERIFQEFTQLENPIQKRVKGTGLGLPLSKKLAELLGGSISLTSALGVGSTFVLTVPAVYVAPAQAAGAVEVEWQPDPSRLPVLVVEDNPETLFIYRKFLRGSHFEAIPAQTLREARQVMARIRPRAIILDILLRGEDAWNFLAEVKGAEATRDIPVLVVTTVDDQRKGMALGADAYGVKPVDRAWLLEKLQQLTGPEPTKRILVIDDEEVARYILRGLLADERFKILEAASGREGIRRAQEEPPHLIFLDLVMPDLSGIKVLEHLKADPRTQNIPVVICTSKVLEKEERRQIAAHAVGILSKCTLSREVALKAAREALSLES